MHSFWKRGALLAAVLVSLALPIPGQTFGRITGRVAAGDGGFIAGAAVEIESPQNGVRSTRTDEDGRYLIPNLPAGSYKVRFRMEGYAPVDKKAQVPLDGRAIVDAKMFKIS